MERRIVSSAIGPLTLYAEEGALARLDFGDTDRGGGEPDREKALLDEARRQLDAYFRGELRAFDLPLRLEGTLFQEACWAALRAISYGETRTYGDIARAVGREKALRAVGGALHVNPVPIIVPCHRVIGAAGGLTGYAGGLEAKRFLLALESRET